jgi:hypothetical protein
MPIVTAKAAAEMIATGKATAADFSPVPGTIFCTVSDTVHSRVFGPPKKQAYDIMAHKDRRAKFGG